MNITLWGTRGSLPSAGPDTVRYGGNTSCVEVRSEDGTLVVLDAGTGIRRLNATVEPELKRVYILLTHLHMDHIQGFGFFGPLFRPDLEVHVFGPPSTTHDLRTRLTKYLSPPLFPVRLRDLPARLALHDVPLGGFEVDGLHVDCNLVTHPGPTVGYRLTERGRTLVYIPDHEPALGASHVPRSPQWTSGYDLAVGSDLLIHDSQYTMAEYAERAGWGHSAMQHAAAVAAMAGVKRLVTFHHDPTHSDDLLDNLVEELRRTSRLPFELTPGQEGMAFHLS
ncbi:MAG: MBL fold metallo-hydrolase [Armatimonadetes bacterium]|nr:MBL fold metallo-hydrolase [Armatimonadota bacterium]